MAARPFGWNRSGAARRLAGACFTVSSTALAQPVTAPEPAGSAAADSTAAPGEALDADPPLEELAEGDLPLGEGDLELAEVTVTVSRARRAPGAVHIVSERTLERHGYDDVHAALQLVPGVYVRQEDGMGLRPNIGIRGALSDRSKKITLLEDGVPFAPAPYSAPAAYYFPLLPRMVQMRVIKGPAAISYGPQTIGGAIDLVTRPIPEGPAASLDVAFGQYGYGKLHGYAGSGDLENGFLIEGVHVTSDGFKRLQSGADTGFYRNEVMFKGVHHFEPEAASAHDLALKLTYSEELSNETYLGLSDADFQRSPLGRYAATGLDRMRWNHTSLVLTHRIEPWHGFSIHTNVYRQDFHRIWRKVNHFRGAALFDVLRNPDTPQNSVFYALLAGQADASSPSEALYIGPNERDFVSQGIESRLRLDATTGPLSHRIEYGLRLHDDRIERRHSEDAYLLIGGQLVPEGSPTLVTAFNEAHSSALAVHALDAITLGPWTLTPGVRLELIRSTFTDKISADRQGRAVQVLLPGVGSYVTLSDGLGVLAGVYRGMSPPPPGAGPQIEPESSVNYEAGLRFQLPGRRAELIGYYNDYSNLTDVCTFSSGCVDENLDRQFEAGRARIYGLEALVEEELELGPARLPLSANYTLTLTEFLESFQSEDPIFGDVQAGDELPYVPRHEGRVSLGVELAPWAGHVSGNYIARMREEAGAGPLDQALTTDSQLTVDAALHYQLEQPLRLRLYAQGRNLFDQRALASRRPFGARPTAPRWLQVGAQLEF